MSLKHNGVDIPAADFPQHSQYITIALSASQWGTFITTWTGMKLYIHNELMCFDYGTVNDFEGDYDSSQGCNATPNGFSLYVPKFYMNSVQGSDQDKIMI